jgi:glycosyltransferase involved in cell wall biosynthesis
MRVGRLKEGSERQPTTVGGWIRSDDDALGCALMTERLYEGSAGRREADVPAAADAKVRAVGVIVPAHNEETLLPQCLESILRACEPLDVDATIAVVLDRCSDRTITVVENLIGRASPILALSARQPGVGAARATGADALVRMFGSDELWLCTTDADSVVPADWIVRQLAHAADGARAVVGTVRVLDWSEHPPPVAQRYASRYRHEVGHRHMHGANLSFHAAAYLAAGGFGHELHDEDVALITRLESLGYSLTWAADLAVTTSARRVGRAPAGFATYLAGLHPHTEMSESNDAFC